MWVRVVSGRMVRNDNILRVRSSATLGQRSSPEIELALWCSGYTHVPCSRTACKVCSQKLGTHKKRPGPRRIPAGQKATSDDY